MYSIIIINATVLHTSSSCKIWAWLWLQLIWKKLRMKVAEKHQKHVHVSLWGAIQYREPKRINKQSLVRSLFCSVIENIMWLNMAIDRKCYENYFSRLFLWNEIVLQLFTHNNYRIVSALSIAALLHMKNVVFLENTLTDRTITQTLRLHARVNNYNVIIIIIIIIVLLPVVHWSQYKGPIHVQYHSDHPLLMWLGLDEGTYS